MAGDGNVACEEKPLKFRIYLCLDGDRDVFLTDYDSVEGALEAINDIFMVLWTHDCLHEIKGFRLSIDEEG
jgi:hypothetical protein